MVRLIVHLLLTVILASGPDVRAQSEGPRQATAEAATAGTGAVWLDAVSVEAVEE